MLLVSRQGKVRLSKWFITLSPKEKTKIIKDVTQLVLSRRTKMCNFLEYKGSAVSPNTVPLIHRYQGGLQTVHQLLKVVVGLTEIDTHPSSSLQALKWTITN